MSLKIGFQNHVDIKEKEKQAAAVINKRKKTREKREQWPTIKFGGKGFNL